jgi:hypothetical protein
MLQCLPVFLRACQSMLWQSCGWHSSWLCFFPLATPYPTATDMNSTVVVFGNHFFSVSHLSFTGGTLILLVCYFYFPVYGGVHWYNGPVSTLKHGILSHDVQGENDSEKVTNEIRKDVFWRSLNLLSKIGQGVTTFLFCRASLYNTTYKMENIGCTCPHFKAVRSQSRAVPKHPPTKKTGYYTHTNNVGRPSKVDHLLD